MAPIVLAPIQGSDFDALVAIRIEAMRESLQRIGRFDAQRARERLAHGFDPERTRQILLADERIGFVVVVPAGDGLHLEHLYVLPSHQKRGVGAAVLGMICGDADRRQLRVYVGALRESDSNRFYVRHGFVQTHASEWDVYYVREPRPEQGHADPPSALAQPRAQG